MEWNDGFSAREVVKGKEKTLQTKLIKHSVKSILQKDGAKGFSQLKDQCY